MAQYILEASKYEEREGEIDRALQVCEEGLQFNSKYGPLWFNTFVFMKRQAALLISDINPLIVSSVKCSIILTEN
jgi:hypothetical protein